jgi:hypothetical protein
MKRFSIAMTASLLGLAPAACGQLASGASSPPRVHARFPGNARAVEAFAAEQARLLDDPTVAKVYVITANDHRAWQDDNIHPPSPSGYLVVISGQFRCAECFTPGPDLPTGTIAAWDLSRRGLRVSSFWLTRRRPNLAALGRVFILPVNPT